MSGQRVAIVTGASRGIGRAVAVRLAASGTAVVVGYAGRAEAAARVVDEITAAGGTAVAAQADVGDEHAVAATFDLAEKTYGGVDVVVNAAGLMVLSPIAELDLDDLDRMYRTNIRGTFVVAREAARRLRDGGSVVTFSTSVVALQFPTYAGYVAGKSAVEGITMILARELRGRQITVNAVAPGPTATDLFLDGKDEATIERLAKQPPLERLGQPDDIAGVVDFLTGPQGHWVNGQVIRANGGIA
ncbi:3-ketoacyl-ACP reductase [Virgisporangium aliadipatigenens]|uniref:3-ketoacyl-ACP reductase n=1 Tax=Virgisporangium aliadipatigenens TaxID=741659 RepID=A0A8J3YNU3_9ACTN|nr:3-ketoacyl-ACP reductase [Virgisporangium aliadipatigenens]